VPSFFPALDYFAWGSSRSHPWTFLPFRESLVRYTDLAALLPSVFHLEDEVRTIPEASIAIRTLPFRSAHTSLLPGAACYTCPEHGLRFDADPTSGALPGDSAYPESLTIPDVEVSENQAFRFAVFSPIEVVRARHVIVLLHGLNERGWSKYLPWAAALCRRTGSAVVLFPIAFHINRSPRDWSGSRVMKRVSDARRVQSPAIANTSIANAAISARVQALPQRFLWSGLQTHHDLSDLLANLRGGAYPFLDPDASIDFFAYSIGAFLCQIFLMNDPVQKYVQSRLFIFCGGPTFDHLYPNSRYILDGDASLAIRRYFVERFDDELRTDARMAHFTSAAHPVGYAFRSMLDSRRMQAQREKWLRMLGTRIHAVALQDDDVVPHKEVLSTLRGADHGIPAQVDVLHFPYPYSHVVPFPVAGAPAAEVDAAFDAVIDQAAAHLARQDVRTRP
jgi:hypothetical protein